VSNFPAVSEGAKRAVSGRRYDSVMAAEDVEIAERFGVALEAAVRMGDREAVYPFLAPDVEWVTPQRTLRGIDDMRENWTWGSSPETFEYAFKEGDWVDHGNGCLSCDVHQVYRLKDTGDLAYERNRHVQLTIHNGKISRYEMTIVG
jgi:ketosteroid isomerase-like protein